MIYRPRLQFSCMILVFVVAAAAILNSFYPELSTYWSGSYRGLVEKNLSAVQVFLKDAVVCSDR